MIALALLVGAALRATPASATADPVPVGAIVPWGGSGAVPSGYLLADGAAVNRMTYADLFAAIGTTWGAGDGSTTFNLPNMRQRIPLGQAAAGTGSTLGGTGGSIDHAPAVAAHTHGISADNAHQSTDTHAHQATAPIGLNSGRTTLIDPYDPMLDVVGSYDFHSIQGGFGGLYPFTLNLVGNNERWTMTSTGPAQLSGSAGSHSHGGATGSAGTTTGAANAPFLAVRYIVKATAGAAAPCGALWHTAQAAPSGGVLAANGSAVNRTTQAELFGCVGTTFGAGDGSTTFNTPELRQRFAMGQAASGTGSVLGGTGGNIDHSHSFGSHRHTIAAAAAHSHSYAHSHFFSNAVGYSSGNMGVPSAADEYHDQSGGSWDIAAVNSMTFYGMINQTFAESGAIERWRMQTDSPDPGSSAAGSHGHTGFTDYASGTTSTANAPFRALQPFVATGAGQLPGAGAMLASGSATTPAGWLLADGSAVSRATYDKLFAAIGTTYGAGDGSTTFNVPDMRGRHALGRAAAGTGATLGGAGGALDHTHAAAHTQPIFGDGAHSHSVPGHTHRFTSPIGKAGASNLSIFSPFDSAMTLVSPGPNFTHIEGASTMWCCMTPTGFGAIEVFQITTSAVASTLTQATNHSHGGSAASASPATTADNSPFASVRYLIRLNSAPLAPTLGSPAPGGVTTDTTPALNATYLDPDPNPTDTGQVEFELCTDAPCSSVVRTGLSAAGVPVGGVTAWSTGTALPIGTYHWRARSIDDEGEIGPWTSTRSFRLDTAPDVPVLQTPAHLASTADTTPNLIARFADVDGDTGTLSVQVCSDAACTGVIRSGSTIGGPSGTDLTWTVSAALVDPSQVWWRAQAVDSWGIASAWSSTWRLDVESATTVSVDFPTRTLSSALLPDTDATATSVVTVGTSDPQGYTLHVTDISDTTSLACACGAALPDWTGTNATPSLWPALTAGGFGVTVLDAPGGRLAKWGTGTGTTDTDFVTNRYAGIRFSSTVVLHTVAAAAAPANVSVGWRANVSTAQAPGAYSGTIAISAIGNP